MNAVIIASVSAAPASVSAQTIFARLLPGLRLPSREAQLAHLSCSKGVPQTSLSPVEQGWSIAEFLDDRAAVAAICFGYEAPKGPLV